MLAIIVPYYKKKFFSQTLQSLEDQTDKRFNLYIGNDASPEDPEQLIISTLKYTEYKYYNYTTNLGSDNLAKQWERIISETTNEDWLMILGDDDMLESNFVEEFYNNIRFVEENEISLIKYSQQRIDENNTPLNKPTELPKVISSIDFIERRLTISFPNSLSEHIFSRRTFKKYLFKKFPLAWHTDDLAILEFADLKNLVFIKESIVKFRISADSISGKDNSTVDKQFASYSFFEYLLVHYSPIFSAKFVHLLIKRYREYIWRNGFPLNVDTTLIYLKKFNFLKALISFKTNKDLRKRVAQVQCNQTKKK